MTHPRLERFDSAMADASEDGSLYVTRMRHSNGWLVSLPARVMSMLEQKELDMQRVAFFGDRKHDGLVRSRLAALAYRDEAFRQAGLDVKKVVKTHSNQPSVSGLLGIVPGYRVSSVTGERYVYRWFALEGIGKREFSVLRLGMTEAFRAAVRHREAVSGIPFELSALKRALRVVRQLPLSPALKIPPVPSRPFDSASISAWPQGAAQSPVHASTRRHVRSG